MMDPKMLETMVLRAVRRLKTEQAPPKGRQLYLMLPEQWDEIFILALERLHVPQEYEVITVFPPALWNEYFIEKIKNTGVCGKLIEQKTAEQAACGEYLTVFPFAARTMIAKAALCIADTFETVWIERCIGSGQKVLLLKSGLAPFSGKESKAYVNKINDYYRVISDYGIELADSIPTVVPPADAVCSTHAGNGNKGRNVITQKEVVSYLSQGRIILNTGDTITLLAREKAQELGIEIIRS